MADFAPNYTSRYKIAYQAHGRRHEVQFRYGRLAAPPPPEFVEGIQDVFDALSASMVSDFALLGETYSVFDTDFFLPINTGLLLIGTNAQGPQLARVPDNINFQALTSAGNRSMFYLYGFLFEPIDESPAGSGNFRLTASESTAVANALAVLQSGIPFFSGPDDNEVIAWKNYVNLNINSYYQRKVRG